MLALRIALRYLFAPKSHKAVNIISVVAMAGVAVATTAIVVVLSVFNGFTDLAKAHLSLIDPDLKVLAAHGKVIENADSIASALEMLPGVAVAMPSLQERGLLSAGNRQKAVKFRGVDPARIQRLADIEGLIIDGVYAPVNGLPDSVAGAQIAVGVAIETGLRPSPYAAAELYVPRRTGRINPANPAAAYRSLSLAVTGVTEVDQPEYDADFLFIPLSEARRLLEYYGGEASAIEIKAAPGVNVDKLKRLLADALGSDVKIYNRMEQQTDTFRMISVEKWVTFAMLIFILLIASFNIVSTLSLMIIEKADNMATLRALGAPHSLVADVFMAEGGLITAVGGFAGIVVGVVLALVQQHFGLIKLAADPTALSIDVYPVRLEWLDVALVAMAIALTGIVIALISRAFTKKLKIEN